MAVDKILEQGERPETVKEGGVVYSIIEAGHSEGKSISEIKQILCGSRDFPFEEINTLLMQSIDELVSSGTISRIDKNTKDPIYRDNNWHLTKPFRPPIISSEINFGPKTFIDHLVDFLHTRFNGGDVKTNLGYEELYANEVYTEKTLHEVAEKFIGYTPGFSITATYSEGELSFKLIPLKPDF